MTQAIRVDSPFATPYRTAKVLGVSKSRTKELIELAGRFTDRLLEHKVARTGPSAVNGHSRRKSAAGVRRKSSVDGGTKISISKASAKRAKATG
jgi:DNA uptake protein ComE-like DNA-binding protein